MPEKFDKLAEFEHTYDKPTKNWTDEMRSEGRIIREFKYKRLNYHSDPIDVSSIVEQFGKDCYIDIETIVGYYDSVDNDIYVRVSRLETEEERDDRLAIIKRREEMEAKRKEATAKARAKKNDQDYKLYQRLKKKFG